MSTDESRPGPETTPVEGGRLGQAMGRVRGKPPAAEEEARSLRLPPVTRGMQAFSTTLFFVLGAAIMWFVVANPLKLGFLPGRPAQTTIARADSAAVAETVYQCPMHPQVVEDAPGTCPICGMELMPVKEPPGTGATKREILYWYAPMDPTYVRDEPGLSPMGMKLVPKYADEAAGSAGVEIRIDPVQVQNIGVVSTEARIADIARQSRTVGILDFDADSITWINTKFEGWVEKAYVTYVGDDVVKGEPLFEIYSPELVTTQEEYIRALDYRESLAGGNRSEALRQAESLVRSTRDRLKYWDITDEQITELERSRQTQRHLTVTSPAGGVVAEVMSEALEGMFVKPGMNLYKIADLSTVWVHADIYELDIPWIRKNQPADVSFRHSPDEQFHGKVLFLYPEVSRDTRTLKICVEVPNPQLRLRPGMYADVVVQGPPVRNAVVAPQSAVIRSGERNIIFIDLGDGRFQPREVSLGVKGDADRIQIVKGVAAGEKVVTQAQFMLDSESRIQEAIAKFRERARDREARPGGQPESHPAH